MDQRPVEAFRNGHFAKVPLFFGSNTNEGARWSAELPDASANTSMPNATQTTVYNFLHGQYASFSRPSFDRAIAEFYPLSDYANFSLQGQQMYGEMRYICTAELITGSAFDHGVKAFQYHYDNPILGSNHAAELAGLFPTAPPADKEDGDLFAAMREYWTTFVGTESTSTTNLVTWKNSAVLVADPID
ncbi:hypothetical protein DXG01_002205 [Tephrocybe rancida]|nr:hypothetical protein DXG01_002205 [Tephrocybe rancida]